MGYQQPSQRDQHAQTPGPAPVQSFAPPPQQYGPPQGQFGPPPAYGQPQYGQPQYGQPAPPQQGGNTSGMGPGYYEPPQTEGWTFAGFVPFGIYAFVMGNVLWGFIGLAAQFFFVFSLVYAIYMGVQGKKLAWQSKRFNNMEEFYEAQHTWNFVGIVCLILGIVVNVLMLVLFVAGVMSDTGQC